MTESAASVDVEPATPADDAALAATLVRAYDDDPIMNWTFRAGAGRDAAWTTYFRLTLEVYHPFGTVFTTRTRQGCAMWAPPGKWRIPMSKQLALAPQIVGMLGLGRLGRGLSTMRRMEHEHPKQPHWYLNLLGVEPALQGQGIGSALVAAGLELCDRDGLGAYLETTNPRNLSLYRRHGFEVTKSFDLGPGTPTFWLMWRDPRAAARL